MTHHKKKIVITGGAGFIGGHVVRAFVSDGYEVHVIDNLYAGRKENVADEATLHECDIRDTERVIDISKGASCIVHLAALPQVQYSIEHPVEAHDVNVNGTLSVFEAARANKISRVVFASSSAVYGDADAPLLEETLPVAPKSPYALHKYVTERYGQLYRELYGIEMFPLRFFNVYGPGARAEGAYSLVTAIFLKRMREGQPLLITGDGEQTRDFIHVHDIARALELAVTNVGGGDGEPINIGSGVPTSINQIAAFYGGEKQYIPARHEPRNSCAATERAKAVLGFTPKVTLAEGIAELIRGNA